MSALRKVLVSGEGGGGGGWCRRRFAAGRRGVVVQSLVLLGIEYTITDC